MEENDLEITEEMKGTMDGAWYYLLTNEYMQNVENVIEYEKI